MQYKTIKSNTAKIILTFGLGILILPCSVFSQNFSIKGTVSDSMLNQPAKFINLVLLNSSDSTFVKGTVTDSTGYYKLEHIPAAGYIIKTSGIGFNVQYNPITVTKNWELNLKITGSDYNLETVEVEKERPLYTVESDRRIYLTANDLSIQDAFAEDAVENTPGVYSDINGNFILRGEAAQIWINGKPSRKKGENLKSFLKLLPASRVEKIEVITNPSARFTATNTNSVINIVLKNNRPENRLYAFGTVLNTDGTFGLWSTAYVKKGKTDFNIYALGSIFSKEQNYYNKSYIVNETDTSFYSESKRQRQSNYTGVRTYAEINHTINNKNFIGWNVYYYNNKNLIKLKNNSKRRFDSPENILIAESENDHTQSVNTNINYTHKIDDSGHSIQLDLDAAHYSMVNPFNISRFSLYNGESVGWKADSEYSFSYIGVIANYNWPVGEHHKINSGLKSYPYYNSNKNVASETNHSEEQNFSFSQLLSQSYTVNEPVTEGYLTFSGKLSSLSYKLGLRYEYNQYDLDQSIPESTVFKEYSNFFPSVHVSYLTKNKHSFSISYSRRGNSPTYYLNPFIDRTNYGYTQQGNPNLQFAGTNSYELSYFKRFQGFVVTASVYQKNTKNDIVSVSETVFDPYFIQTVVLQTYANAGESKYSGSELSLSSSVFKNLKLNLYANAFYQNMNGEYNEQIFSNESFVYNGRLSASYNFFDRFNLQIIPTYYSDNPSLYKTSKSKFYTNAFLSFDLWDRRISSSVKARDIFGTRTIIDEYRLNDFYQYSESDYIFQKIQFIFLWRIGNPKYDRQAKINQLAR